VIARWWVHRRTEDALLDSEARLKAVVTSARDAIVAVDAGGRVTMLNPAAEAMFGQPVAAVVGLPLESLVPGAWAVALAGGEERSAAASPLALTARRADGATLPVEATIAGTDVAGQALYAVVLRDVTERRRIAAAQAALADRERAARTEAEAASRAKDEFLAVLSHELREPLTAIIGWGELLRSGRLPAAEAARALERIQRNARLQAHLVNDLLDVSRIVSGKFAIDLRPAPLAPIVEAAVDAIRLSAETKGIHLDAVVDRFVGAVRGDAGRLQQVVTNLLTNAVKFTPSGGRVEVVLTAVGDLAELIVRDTGRGIVAEFLPRVFDRFAQGERVHTRASGGLGLGLAIARHLVELHGGSIEAHSAGEGRGATFVVRLPLLAGGPPSGPLRG
jgi:PAS domain S-box-containing protein